jgi:hypothetical protein
MRAAACSGGRSLQSTRNTSKPAWTQSFGRLPVEMHFGLAAAERELEAVMRPARIQPLIDNLRVRLENYGQVGPIGFGVKLP